MPNRLRFNVLVSFLQEGSLQGDHLQIFHPDNFQYRMYTCRRSLGILEMPLQTNREAALAPPCLQMKKEILLK